MKPTIRRCSTSPSTTSISSCCAPANEHTYCPYKGEASYYDILPGDGETWRAPCGTTPTPTDAVEAIRGHVAFYADRVTITSDS